ncbi:MAG: alkaline phosphatase family protein [Rhodobacterales bacterium]|nr:alkaline phosphatase family protein [Rhodobacterales bacterium]
MNRLLVLDVVGLTPDLLRHAPHLSALAGRGGRRALDTVFPAVTTTVQASMLTGLTPAGHGIVGNGWYVRDLAEVMFWRQANALVGGDRVWRAGRRRDPAFTTAKLFWWYNMYADVDWAVTPRPMYPADGRKLPDIHSHPAALRDHLNGKLGTFPLFRFWGPASDIVASRWITDCALDVVAEQDPTLTLVYLPHLDYCLQKLGPDHPDIAREVAAVDALCGELIAQADARGAATLVVSEYGITPVSGAVMVNQALRRAGWLAVRTEMGLEQLDAGASAAFAVADHQAAHVYVRDPELIPQVRAVLEGLDGVEHVLDRAGQAAWGIDHERSGELVCVSAADRWFCYYHWLDDARAPDYARTVDIHRKPGYDPVELFLDPKFAWPLASVGWRVARRKLGLRGLIDVIPLRPDLVKGSHGRPGNDPEKGPLVISSEGGFLPPGAVPATAVHDLILAHVFA